MFKYRRKRTCFVLLSALLMLAVAACTPGSGAATPEPTALSSRKAQALVRDFVAYINDPANYTEFVEKERAYEKAIAEKDAAFLQNVVENGLGLGRTSLLTGAYGFFDRAYYPDLDSFWDKGMDPQPIYALFAMDMAHYSRYPIQQQDEGRYIKHFELTELNLVKEYEVDALGEPKVYLAQEYLLKGTYHTDRAAFDVVNPIKVHVTLDEQGEHKLKYFTFQNNGTDSVGYVMTRMEEMD